MAMQPAPQMSEAYPVLPPMLAAGSAVSTPSAHPDAAPQEEDTALFDRWLRRELGRLHDNVLREPVPDRLRWIIEDHRSEPG